MTAADLATAGFIDEWMRALVARLDQLGGGAAAPAPAVVVYSKQQLAEALGVHVDTVGAWLRKGKKGRGGHVVKLQAFQFTSEPRIPWPAVLAYHRGEEFDLNTVPAPVPAAAPAAPTTLSRPEGSPLLRVA